ncbi:DNA primase [Acidisoma sp.]|uniref:DNA primase n=1 Tax=Acidisoma sp. TaxID=1872115 RepID=UPI003B001B82
MALPPSFLDELRARTPLPALIGRRTKLTRSSRDWKGCCPFHNEKSPSFYVYADHYHCFGCGAHGDAIGFVMQTQNAGFMEAVETLAAEAGLEVPRASPDAVAAERRRTDLHEVLALAAKNFEARLATPEGRPALDYLRRRGLTDETISRFGLGYSGAGRGALAADLARAGVEPRQLSEAGLTKQPEDGRAIDLFFGRVMFPIRDPRGRVISFGGRIMGEGQPKYLNGPETALFSKRRTLYGLDLAKSDLAKITKRDGTGRRQGLVVVEGYMDVIALSQAGVPAVAPLGTAITPEQMDALWQQDERPVFCFDGDAAGRRAGRRAIGLALPRLAPERSIGIVVLPEGEDPDTVVGRRGRQGMTDELARDDLGAAIYGLIKDEVGPISNEGWATFKNRLQEIARAIPDRALGETYRATLTGRWFQEFRAASASSSGRNVQRRASGSPFRGNQPPPVPIGPRPRVSEETQDAERGRVLLAILLTHPDLLPDLEEPFDMLDLPHELAHLRDALRAWLDTHPVLDSEALNAHLRRLGYDTMVSAVLDARPLPACAMPGAAPAEAASHWWQIYGFMRGPHIEADLKLAERDFVADPTEINQRKLIALTLSWDRVRRGEMDATA